MPIKFPILYAGSKSKTTLDTLFEPNNLYSFIRKDFAEKLGMISTFSKYRTFNIAPYNIVRPCPDVINLTFTINNLRLLDEFMVIPDLPEEVIFGDTTIRKWGMKLDHENNAVIIDPRVAEFMLKKAV